MKLSDVVNRINGNVDRFTTDLEYYIGGEHMESNELEITKGGNLKENSTYTFPTILLKGVFLKVYPY